MYASAVEPEKSVEELIATARHSAVGGRQRILGLTGAIGAGKSEHIRLGPDTKPAVS